MKVNRFRGTLLVLLLGWSGPARASPGVSARGRRGTRARAHTAAGVKRRSVAQHACAMPPKKYETTHNKRSGIFYGAASGHPIIWNNDWHSLIQKEVLARDNFSRDLMAGKLHAPVPVYKDVSIDNTNWNMLLKSTYMDLGKWGGNTFRQNVPHIVGKKEAENPSVPPTGAPSEAMSEYAYRHARQQLGKTMIEPYKSRAERGATKPPTAAAAAAAVQAAAAAKTLAAEQKRAEKPRPAPGNKGGKGGVGQQQQPKQGSAVALETLKRDPGEAKLAKSLMLLSVLAGNDKALRRSLEASKKSAGPVAETSANHPPARAAAAPASQRSNKMSAPQSVRSTARSASVPVPEVVTYAKVGLDHQFHSFVTGPGSASARSKLQASESANWRSVYEDLGRWGDATARGFRPKVVTKTDVEIKGKDINRPVYPDSPKPSRFHQVSCVSACLCVCAMLYVCMYVCIRAHARPHTRLHTAEARRGGATIGT